jgi:hypothetical protein
MRKFLNPLSTLTPLFRRFRDCNLGTGPGQPWNDDDIVLNQAKYRNALRVAGADVGDAGQDRPGVGYCRPLNGLPGPAVQTFAEARERLREGAAMRQVLLTVIGVAVVLAGLVWTLQGLGYVGGSFMSGATVWAVIGPVVALAGLVLIVIASRSRRRAR